VERLPIAEKQTSAKGRRGRPTKERVAAISEVILATALDMFLSHGYSATSMEAVAAQAGISKGTLYARYPSKADLFTAIIEDRVAAWSEAASGRDHELPSDLAGRVRHHVLISLQSMVEPEIAAFAAMITAERKRFPELARIYYDRAVGYELAMLARDIAEAANHMGLKVRDPDAAALALLQMSLGWASIRALSGEAVTQAALEAAADRIVAFLTQGLSAW